MNKKIFVVHGLFFIFVMFGIWFISAECTDSDGFGYDTKGEVNIRSFDDNLTQNYNDACVYKLEETNVQHYVKVDKILYNNLAECSEDNCYVAEAICSYNELSWQVSKCANGCKDGACISGTSTSNTSADCKNLYWFDSTSKECGYKEFCGAYMYYGLKTFDNEDKCEKELNEDENEDNQNLSEDSREKNSEKVTCVFKNSQIEQKCYLGKGEGLHKGVSCSGVGSCVIEVNGKKGGEITWKSSCGGYQYTKQDEIDDTIEFDCSGGESNITLLKINDVKYAYWQCYDGKEGKAGDGESCYPSKRLQKRAKEDCKEHCKGEKCGVNSFSVGGNCYLEEYVGDTNAEDIENIYDSNASEFKADLICKDSCPFEDKCYPFGYRKAEKYCSDNGAFIEQLKSDETCDNNFECSSNVCVSGKCIDAGFLQKIMNWFRKLFGG
ncbi:hypothetical protein J4429_05700 [Candidatus Pacearchaeota archaeon]|nr:hypothetical protein [Candidatus Pacearchaeota archaeon]